MHPFLKILHSLLHRKVAERAERLVREAEGAHTHSMIVYLLAKEMTALGPDLSCHLLRHLVMGAAERRRGYPEYLQHVGDVRAVASHAGNDFMSEVLSRSRRLQMDEVVELLTDLPPQRRIYHTEEAESGSPAQDYIPLGVRKSMARRANPGTIESLLREQDPSVVRNLLSNPRTVEEMVVKMASLRPTSAQVLEEIFVHPRWSTRYPVRKALAFNPYSPPRAVHALLPTLLLGDLIDVTLSSSLHPNLRGAAKRLLIRRVAVMTPAEREQFNDRYGTVMKRIFLLVG